MDISDIIKEVMQETIKERQGAPAFLSPSELIDSIGRADLFAVELHELLLKHNMQTAKQKIEFTPGRQEKLNICEIICGTTKEGNLPTYMLTLHCGLGTPACENQPSKERH